jgi:hypothetical protein
VQGRKSVNGFSNELELCLRAGVIEDLSRHIVETIPLIFTIVEVEPDIVYRHGLNVAVGGVVKAEVSDLARDARETQALFT